MRDDDLARGIGYGVMAYFGLSALALYLSATSVFHSWDHNSDGAVTIRDVAQLVGETLSVPYVIAYQELTGAVRFFEIPPPYVASIGTAVAGIFWGFLAVALGSYMAGAVLMWLSRFPAHWRQ